MGLLRVGEKDALPLLAGGRLAAVPRPARPSQAAVDAPPGARPALIGARCPPAGAPQHSRQPDRLPERCGISARPAARRGPADGRVLAGGRLAAVSTPREARQAARATPSVPHIGGTPMGPEN